jgi:hypothetical protein
MLLHEGVEAYKKEGPKFMQRLVAKQKARVKDSGPGRERRRPSLTDGGVTLTVVLPLIVPFTILWTDDYSDTLIVILSFLAAFTISAASCSEQ